MKTPFFFLLAYALPAFADPTCLELVDHSVTHPIPLRGTLANAFKDVYLQNLDLARPDAPPGAFRIPGLENKNKSELDLSPDGKRILFTIRPALDDWNNESQIALAGRDGTRPVILAQGKDLRYAGPVWFPDGRKILFSWWKGVSSKSSRLMTMDLRTWKKTPVPLPIAGTGDPEISYDGKRIAFKAPAGEGTPYGIFVANVDGTEMRQLTRGFSDHDPVFSRDNRKLYFERYYGQGDWFGVNEPLWGIVEVDIETGGEKVLVPHDPCKRHFFWLPTVSPDGKYVMYVHVDKHAAYSRVPETDLWVSRADGSHPQKVRGADWFYYFDWGN